MGIIERCEAPDAAALKKAKAGRRDCSEVGLLLDG
jgi:hypothetical protein